MGFDSSNPYGAIADWDVSAVESFDGAFTALATFNEDISAWDVASGTSFKVSSISISTTIRVVPQMYPLLCLQEMFFGASSFNADLSDWDVGEGRKFTSM